MRDKLTENDSHRNHTKNKQKQTITLEIGPETLLNREISTRAFKRWYKYLNPTKSDRLGEKTTSYHSTIFTFLNKTLSNGANGDPRSFQKERAQNSGSGGGPKTSVRFFLTSFVSV